MEVFLDKMIDEKQRIEAILETAKPLKMTDEDTRRFKEAENCFICDEPLGVDRVRDHDHVTGAFRGAAHSDCNLQYRLKHNNQFVIPVVFHNLKGYDSHHIMEKLGKYKDKRITVIPNTTEKYISFSIDNIRFIDSLQFMNASLEKLVGNLAEDGKHKFVNMCKYIPDDEQ